MEPLAADSSLGDLESVCITPRESIATWDIGQPIINRFRENLWPFAHGQPLLSVVDKQVRY